MDGVAVAWNSRCTLSAMLSARAHMETFAVMAELERRVTRLLKDENLGALDALAQNGIFASRDNDWIEEAPEAVAVNVVTYIDKLDKKVPPGDASDENEDRLLQRRETPRHASELSIRLPRILLSAPAGSTLPRQHTVLRRG
jgi:hypothetical protein